MRWIFKCFFSFGQKMTFSSTYQMKKTSYSISSISKRWSIAELNSVHYFLHSRFNRQTFWAHSWNFLTKIVTMSSGSRLYRTFSAQTKNLIFLSLSKSVFQFWNVYFFPRAISSGIDWHVTTHRQWNLRWQSVW